MPDTPDQVTMDRVFGEEELRHAFDVWCSEQPNRPSRRQAYLAGAKFMGAQDAKMIRRVLADFGHAVVFEIDKAKGKA